MQRYYRTIWATVTTAEDGLVTFKVTQVDDRINPTLLTVDDEPLITGWFAYAPVVDKGKNTPIFDFYSTNEGVKTLEVGMYIVVLCEVKDDELVYIHWTTKNEYQRCQSKIEARIGTRKATPAKQQPRVAVDSRFYRLTHDNQKFTGTVVNISIALYRYNKKSQSEGWPTDCTWEVHEGRKFTTCEAPTHPGVNNILEPRVKAAGKDKMDMVAA